MTFMKSAAGVIALSTALAFAPTSLSANAQQVPIPQTAAEVPGPAPGPMTKAYVQMVGRMAYLWGWPLVYVYNQRTELTKVPEPFCSTALCHRTDEPVAMLTGYVNPAETYIADPNQDVVYGLGYLSLEKEPVVIQVPDFGDRFWTLPVYDARTDQISELGLQYGTKPGFYMIVGPNWKGDTPAGIAGVVRSSTDFAVTMPRIFMNDTPEDHAAIQPALSQILFYPLSQFDGKMKTKDWSKIPKVERKGKPAKYSSTQPPWVDPATFFDHLPTVMKQVPPMPGEEALYKWIGSVLDAAAKDPEVMKTLRETAFAADKELIAPMMRWRYNGQPAGNGWTSPANNGAFGTDYYSPHGRSEGRSLRQQAQRNDVFLHRQRHEVAAACGQVILCRHLPERAASAGEGLLVVDDVQPGTFLLPERTEALRARHEEQVAEVQPRRLSDHLSRDEVARQRQGIQLAAGTGREFLDLAPRLLARPGDPRRHLEAADSEPLAVGRQPQDGAKTWPDQRPAPLASGQSSGSPDLQ